MLQFLLQSKLKPFLPTVLASIVFVLLASFATHLNQITGRKTTASATTAPAHPWTADEKRAAQIAQNLVEEEDLDWGAPISIERKQIRPDTDSPELETDPNDKVAPREEIPAHSRLFLVEFATPEEELETSGSRSVIVDLVTGAAVVTMRQ